MCCIMRPNARPELRPEAAAQRTLLAVSSRPMLDAGLTREKHAGTPLAWALSLKRPAVLLVPAPTRVRRLGHPRDSAVCTPDTGSRAGAGGTGGSVPDARARG